MTVIGPTNSQGSVVTGLEWPQYTGDGQYLRFDLSTQVFKPQNPNCAFLDAIGYSLTSVPERVDRTRRSR